MVISGPGGSDFGTEIPEQDNPAFVEGSQQFGCSDRQVPILPVVGDSPGQPDTVT